MEEDDTFDFSAKRKKKSKKKVVETAEEHKGESALIEQTQDPWSNADKDYTYQELLSRVYDSINANNTDYSSEKTVKMIVPIVQKDGSKKTKIVNFVEICQRMNRTIEHVMQYLFVELSTSGSPDSQQQLIVKGKFVQRQIENVLRTYIWEYATCRNCKSMDTVLTKENRLTFVKCNICQTSRSVAAIKTGFQAQTTKRRLMRA